MKSLKILSLLLFFATIAKGQMGGDLVYPFLSVPTSARAAGLGGSPISVIDNDLNLAIINPALLSDTMNLSLVLNYTPYFSDTKNTFLAFAKSWKDVGNFSLGMNYLSYGTFNGFDVAGLPAGTFSGSDLAIYALYSRKLSQHISAGITIKPIFTHLSSYSTSALTTDIGFNYSNLSRMFSAGIVLRNYGTQFTNYNDAPLETIQPDLAFSVSQKLMHAPFRLLLTAQNLTQWDLTYNVVDRDNGSAVKLEDVKSYSFGNKVLRHLVFGVEFIPSRNFYVDVSYNGRIRQELQYESSSSFVGFAFGFGFRVKQFQFGYAVRQYHASSTGNFFSITANFGQFAVARRKITTGSATN